MPRQLFPLLLLLASNSDSQDGLLYLQELGRLQQLAGDTAASKVAFQGAFARYEAADAEARLRVSGMAAGTASLITNDNALPYNGYAYERIFAHAYQALNYLSEGDGEGAQVELRRAALEQRVQRAAAATGAAEPHPHAVCIACRACSFARPKLSQRSLTD